jgi:hypothetical protein
MPAERDHFELPITPAVFGAVVGDSRFIKSAGITAGPVGREISQPRPTRGARKRACPAADTNHNAAPVQLP